MHYEKSGSMGCLGVGEMASSGAGQCRGGLWDVESGVGSGKEGVGTKWSRA